MNAFDIKTELARYKKNTNRNTPFQALTKLTQERTCNNDRMVKNEGNFSFVLRHGKRCTKFILKRIGEQMCSKFCERVVRKSKVIAPDSPLGIYRKKYDHYALFLLLA